MTVDTATAFRIVDTRLESRMVCDAKRPYAVVCGRRVLTRYPSWQSAYDALYRTRKVEAIQLGLVWGDEATHPAKYRD